MSALHEEIDRCAYLELVECAEPETNALRVVVAEARAGLPGVDPVLRRLLQRDVVTSPIETTPECALFEVVWPSYVAYGVRNESFTTPDDREVFEGRNCRVYGRSEFRDYVGRATVARDEQPGPLTHWGLICLMHLVDVIGCEEPVITRLR